MPHKLDVIPFVEVDGTQAELRIRGCFTGSGNLVLQPLISRALTVKGVRSVVVDFGSARHIDHDAVEWLRHNVPNCGFPSRPSGTVRLKLPRVIPLCPAHRPRTTSRDDERPPAGVRAC